MKINIDLIYPINSIYKSTSATNPSTIFGGTWTLVSKSIIDTGWQDYIYTNSTYIGTTQSSYNRNKWRVKNNILYVECGAGATAIINTASEDEIARIPITGSTLNTASIRVWNGAVGGSGAVAGFQLKQEANYLTVNLKPHTTSSYPSSYWFSTHFSVVLPDDVVITNMTPKREYIWERTA